jgi:hypothetical protein
MVNWTGELAFSPFFFPFGLQSFHSSMAKVSLARRLEGLCVLRQNRTQLPVALSL